jgi:hypothetical protein
MTGASRHSICNLATLWITLAAVTSVASPASAAVLAYEGFEYPAGTLLISGGTGLNGGMGWAGPWDETQAASFSTATQAGSLAYTDGLGNVLQTTGGKLLNTGVDGTSQPGRTLAARRESPALGNTVTTWLSFLGQRIGALNADGGQFDGTYRRGANLAIFDLSGVAQPEKLDLGENSNVQYPLPTGGFEDRWQTRSFVSASVTFDQPYPPNPMGAATQGQARDAYSEAKFADVGLFVMRIDHVAGDSNAATTGNANGGNDNVYIWMNPNLNTTPSDANASIKYVSTDIVARANALGVLPYQGEPPPGSPGGGGELSFDRLRLFAGNVAGTTPFAEWLFDEVRIGESFADVTPHTAAGVAGDYNQNNVVDAADYVAWRNNPATLPNEGASPGVVDQADYNFWRARFGANSGAAAGLSAAVPEPATGVLMAMIVAACFSSRTRRVPLLACPAVLR